MIERSFSEESKRASDDETEHMRTMLEFGDPADWKTKALRKGYVEMIGEKVTEAAQAFVDSHGDTDAWVALEGAMWDLQRAEQAKRRLALNEYAAAQEGDAS